MRFFIISVFYFLVTGMVQPGQLCAIMGATDSGKRTLLDVISFRDRSKFIIDGDVKINGKTVGWRELNNVSGFVPKEDVFLGTLKVKEHLTFLALMKMHPKARDSKRYERVDQVLTEMDLMDLQESIIGQEGRLGGISYGDKRRLAVASEILSNPQLLFCEEPTTGLDHFMSESVADTLSYLARQGKTVICTIDQPTSQVFEKFDVLCLLAEGRVAYFGPSQNALRFFESIGRPSKPLYNPADHYIQVLSVLPESKDECIKKVNAICDTYDQSEYKQVLVDRVNASVAPVRVKEVSEPPNIQKYNASFAKQLKWLLWRQSVNSLREPVSGKGLIIQTLFVSLFLGLIYLQLKRNEKGVQNRNGLLFVLLMQVTFGYIFPLLNSFPLELQVFYKEKFNRVYSCLSYYLAHYIAELPKYVILPFILITISYWMADVYSDGGAFITIAIILLLGCHVSLNMGRILSILSPTSNIALSIAAPLLLVLIVFTGIFINYRVPDYMVWIKYLSFYYYAHDGYTIKLWKDINSIDCSLPDINGCRNPGCYRNGNDVLSTLGVSTSNYDRDIGLLIIFIIILTVVGYFALRLKARRA